VGDYRDEDVEISGIRARLASLEAERAELEASLAEIERLKAGAQAINACSILAANIPTVTTASPTADKVALFRHLFAGDPTCFRSAGRTQRRERRAMRPPAPMNGYDRFFPSQDTMPVGGFGTARFSPRST
jgi:hypothetical protein